MAVRVCGLDFGLDLWSINEKERKMQKAKIA